MPRSATPGALDNLSSNCLCWFQRNTAGTVLRGGSWNNNPRNVRVSNRNRNEPTNRNNNNGFRCAGDVELRLVTSRWARAGVVQGRIGRRHLRFRAVVPTLVQQAGVK